MYLRKDFCLESIHKDRNEKFADMDNMNKVWKDWASFRIYEQKEEKIRIVIGC